MARSATAKPRFLATFLPRDRPEGRPSSSGRPPGVSPDPAPLVAGPRTLYCRAAPLDARIAAAPRARPRPASTLAGTLGPPKAGGPRDAAALARPRMPDGNDLGRPFSLEGGRTRDRRAGRPGLPHATERSQRPAQGGRRKPERLARDRPATMAWAIPRMFVADPRQSQVELSGGARRAGVSDYLMRARRAIESILDLPASRTTSL
jgi:hypothetical protein